MLNNYKDFISYLGYPFSSVGKESTCNVGYLGLIPGLGRSPEEGKVYPLQYPDLKNSMDCIVHGVTESDMAEQLSLHFLHLRFGMHVCYAFPLPPTLGTR